MQEQNERRQKFLKQVPELYKTAFDKAYAKQGRTSAVKAKCIDCSGFSHAEAGECVAVTCPLFEYNPYRIKRLKREAGELEEDLLDEVEEIEV